MPKIKSYATLSSKNKSLGSSKKSQKLERKFWNFISYRKYSYLFG